MQDDADEKKKDLPPGVSPPPSKADLAEVSKDQALIADEWAPAPPHPEKTGDVGG